jgi:hypothetical protein
MKDFCFRLIVITEIGGNGVSSVQHFSFLFVRSPLFESRLAVRLPSWISVRGFISPLREKYKNNALIEASIGSSHVLFNSASTHWIGGWVGPRAGLDDVEKRKFLTLPGLELRPLGLPARSQSLYRLRYPGSIDNIVMINNKFNYFRKKFT